MSKNPSEESLSDASELIRFASSSQELSSVFRLLTESLEITRDRFKGFLAAWAALEIFINKSFKLYEKKFISGVSDAHSSHGVNNFLNRIQKVMKDKYRLTDKLSLIASFLSDDIEDDILFFDDIKKLRDEISHGNLFIEEELPLEKTRVLLGKYLEAHLKTLSDD